MSNGGPRTLLPAPLLTSMGALLVLFLLLVGILSGVGNDAAEADGDSSRIVFDSTRNGGLGDIFVMTSTGDAQTNLTQEPSASDTLASWSPDGSKIAFTTFGRGGDNEIYVMDANDGSNQTNLTNHPAHDAGPSWSPDGSKIAFHSDRQDGRQEIYVMTVSDPANLTRLTTNARNVNPAWYPNGSRIAFQSLRDLNWEIYVMDADDEDGDWSA